MAHGDRNRGRKKAAIATFAAAAFGLALPGAVLAVGGPATTAVIAPALPGLPFTPANVDRSLALKVAQIVGSEGLRFTPANRTPRDRTVTVAVRVDPATARAISVRNALDTVSDEARSPAIAIVATRYDLGIARGYQSFVQPSRQPVLDAGVRDVRMPDLATFQAEPETKGKPGRFQSRIALEQATRTGRSEGSYGALAEQSVDVRGSYRVTRNLDVTAGVRLSQERDRLAPLTDGVDDDKAVYLGTQFKF